MGLSYHPWYATQPFFVNTPTMFPCDLFYAAPPAFSPDTPFPPPVFQPDIPCAAPPVISQDSQHADLRRISSDASKPLVPSALYPAGAVSHASLHPRTEPRWRHEPPSEDLDPHPTPHTSSTLHLTPQSILHLSSPEPAVPVALSSVDELSRFAVCMAMLRQEI
jgi:hypothetical protein